MSVERTILLSIEYHGLDEAIVHKNAYMTRRQIRAVLTWMRTLLLSDFPSEDCCTGVNIIYRLLNEHEVGIEAQKIEVLAQIMENPEDEE